MAPPKINGTAARAELDAEYQAGGPISEKLDRHPGGTVTIWNRIDHFTFAWYTFPMTTGGIALLLSVQPHTFNGLLTIGKVVYIFDLVIFTLITSLIVTRFARKPARIRACFQNNTEALFIPTFFLSCATIIGGMHQYGVPSTGHWLIVTLRVLYWIYAPVTFLWAVIQYWYLFTAARMTIQSMTPAWILPIFPVMLTGTLASLISGSESPDQAMPILVAGVAFQGLGFWVALMMYAVFIARLMESGLPGPNLRPGMFISVGPPSFTGLALIGMSGNIPLNYEYFALHPTAAEALQQTALAFAVFIWGISLWFFCVSFLSCLVVARKMSFHLVWYAYIFPNSGFVIAMISIGNELHSPSIGWVGSGASILLVIMYLFVLSAHVRALINRDIMWPGKDEDKDE